MNKINRYLINEKLMQALSVIVIGMLFIELSFELNYNIITIFKVIDIIIWLIFVYEYIYRLSKSNCKRNFILSNKIDLIAILPINSLFKSLRALKIFKLAKLTKLSKLLKLTVFLKKYFKSTSKFLKTNNINYIIYITFSTILLGAIAISFIEDMSFQDSIWWSFVTATTVGYGDLSPSTGLGRIIAGILMLVGIGFVSLLTGSLASFLLAKKDEKDKSYKSEVINDIKTRLDNLDELSDDDLDNIFKTLKSLKS